MLCLNITVLRHFGTEKWYNKIDSFCRSDMHKRFMHTSKTLFHEMPFI